MCSIFSIGGHSVAAFSDTHGHHRDHNVPEGADVIICAGDAVEDDMKGGEYDDFIEWFSSLPARWKLFIPGNHELSFERGRADDIAEKMAAIGITVLQDAVEDCDGVIVGSVSEGAHVADDDIPMIWISWSLITLLRGSGRGNGKS